MKNNPAIFMSDDFISVTFISDGKSFIIRSGERIFKDVKDLIIKSEWGKLRTLFDREKQIKNFSNGELNILDGVIYYGKTPVHNIVANRIIDFAENGLPYDNLKAFLKNCLEIGNKVVLDELYLFLETNETMPITQDGAFVAYRVVCGDYFSKTRNPDGTRNRNIVGDVVTMDRDKCDHDRNNTCSSGLHFCSKSYIPNYYRTGDRIMVIKVFPQDVVSIPYDYNNAKGRCCKYEVIAEIEGDEYLELSGYFYDEVCDKQEIRQIEDNHNVNTKDEEDYSRLFDAVEIKIMDYEVKQLGKPTLRDITKNLKPYISCSKVYSVLQASGKYDIECGGDYISKYKVSKRRI